MALDLFMRIPLCSAHLLQVVRCEGHARQQLPHGLGQVEVERLSGPNGHTEKQTEELEVTQVFGGGAAWVEDEAVGVEADLVGGVGCWDE